MPPTWGRSLKGTRCLGLAPHGHWHTTTYVCALRTCGLAAPCVFDGPINSNAFCTCVQQVLVLVLRPGDIVVMDNLGSHKVAGIAAAIEAAGEQVRYLPPCSPDYNPIEQVTLLRKSAARRWMPFGLSSAICSINSMPPNVNDTFVILAMASQAQSALDPTRPRFRN
ncbi:transposase [Noviherbaspirillum saxi]|uniref:Transposase n=2 Tax=Noviherbaspirillum saxi TaxID=2320863 RepID=A0A3A3FMA0_9BURK|nr:transposase [Noviherbaspirillum saxi]